MSSLRLALKLSMEAEEPPPSGPSESELAAKQAAQKKKRQADRDSEKNSDNGKDGESKKGRSDSISSAQSDAQSNKKKSSSHRKKEKEKEKDSKGKDDATDSDGGAATSARRPGQNQWTKKRELEARERESSIGGDAGSGGEGGSGNKDKDSDRDLDRDRDRPDDYKPRSHKKKVVPASDTQSAGGDGNSVGGGGGDNSDGDDANQERSKDKRGKASSSSGAAGAAPKRSHAKKKTVAPRETADGGGGGGGGEGEGGEEDGDGGRVATSDTSATPPSKRPRSYSDNNLDSSSLLDILEGSTPRYQSSRAAAQVAKEKITNKGNPRYGVIEEASTESEFAVYRAPTKTSSRSRQSQAAAAAEEDDDDEEEDRVEPQWVQCNRCDKWRTAPASVDISELPEQWFCEMNTWDAFRASCEAGEEVVADPNDAAAGDDDDYVITDGSAAAAVSTSSRSKSRGKSRGRNAGSRDRDRDSFGGGRSSYDGSEGLSYPLGGSGGGAYDGLLAGTVQVLETNWVQCAKCEKWRTVPLSEAAANELPDTWECKDNVWNPAMASCTADEEVAPEALTQEQLAEMQQRERAAAQVQQRTGSGRGRYANQSFQQQQQQQQLAAMQGLGGPIAPAAPAAPAPSQWVQCDRKGCRKWRVVPSDFDMESLPEKWFCEMNSWNTDRASCDVPDDNEEEAAAKPNVRSSLIMGNNKGPGTLSYRRIIFGTDGKVRPAYSEHNQRGYGIFSHVAAAAAATAAGASSASASATPAATSGKEKGNRGDKADRGDRDRDRDDPTADRDENAAPPVRSISYWWSGALNDLNGPRAAHMAERVRREKLFYDGRLGGNSITIAGVGAGKARVGGGVGVGGAGGGGGGSSSPRSPRAGRQATGAGAGADAAAPAAATAASSLAGGPMVIEDDPEDQVNGAGFRLLLDPGKNNGYTNHYNSKPRYNFPLLAAARKLAGYDGEISAPPDYSGRGKFHKYNAANSRMTIMERAFLECTVVRSCLLATCSAAGHTFPAPAISSELKKDKEKEKEKEADGDREKSKHDGEADKEQGKEQGKDRHRDRHRERDRKRDRDRDRGRGEKEKDQDKSSGKEKSTEAAAADSDGGGDSSSDEKEKERERERKERADPPSLSTDTEGIGGAKGSVSLTLLLRLVQNAFFHDRVVDVVRASFDMDKLRTTVHRLETQGEVVVSISLSGEPCVQNVPLHMGNGALKSQAAAAASELAEHQGIPLKMRKIAARRKESSGRDHAQAQAEGGEGGAREADDGEAA